MKNILHHITSPIEDRISLLPDELKRYIYDDFVKTLQLLNEFKTCLESQITIYLDDRLIRPYIPIILANPNFIKICRNNIKEFDTAYIDHKINKKKQFRRMNNGDSFSKSILLYKYPDHYPNH